MNIFSEFRNKDECEWMSTGRLAHSLRTTPTIANDVLNPMSKLRIRVNYYDIYSNY